MATKFWGVEVKAGKRMRITPGYCQLFHISQAALGVVKDVKEAISVPIRLKIGDENYVIGNLSAEDKPQLMFDLIIQKEFELSHDWKSGSVYFAGYRADDPYAYYESDGDEISYSSDEISSSDEEGDLELEVQPKGILEPKEKEDGGFSNDETEDSSTSDEEDRSTKKRPSESVAEIPVAAKKAKVATPEKTGGKKGQAGKAPAPGNKSKDQAPKPGKPLSSGKKAKRGGK